MTYITYFIKLESDCYFLFNSETGDDVTQKKFEKKFDAGFSKDKYSIKKYLIYGISLFLLLSTMGYFLGWFSDAASVAKKEFSATAMLKKYEYFKDASQQIIAKKNDIVIYESKINRLCTGNDLDRVSRENCGLYEQELAGLKMSFNSLAAEYNSQSNKFNWKSFDQTEGDSIPKNFKTR